MLQLTWKYTSSFRTVTSVVLFGLLFCNNVLQQINFLACYLHSQKCQYWVLDSNQLILSTIVELKGIRGMSDSPCYWSHMPKNLLSVRWRCDSRKKKLIVISDLEDIFETGKVSFFYCLSIWQHIKSVHLECLKTKQPYVGPISYCQIGPIFLHFWRVFP